MGRLSGIGEQTMDKTWLANEAFNPSSSWVWEADGAVRASGGVGRGQGCCARLPYPPRPGLHRRHAEPETQGLQWRLEDESRSRKVGIHRKWIYNVAVLTVYLQGRVRNTRLQVSKALCLCVPLPELCSSSPSCCCWMSRPTIWTWMPACGWRRSSRRKSLWTTALQQRYIALILWMVTVSLNHISGQHRSI